MENREIKFRAWDKEKKKMIYGIGVLGTIGVMANNVKDTKGSGIMISPKSEYFIPQQFTGLKDKNGKEIYEKDIVWTLLGNIVVEDMAQFLFMLGGRPKQFLEHLKVIGNIYSNPELIKQYGLR